MCDLHPRNRLGWRGWPKLPKMVTGEAAGAWHDLSHRLHEGLPVPHVFPEPKIERVMSMPEGRLNVTKIELACHVGTHLDAPVHLLMDGPGFDEIPLEMLHGPGVVWSIDAEPFAEIGTAQLEALSPALEPGDILLLHAGWSDRWGTDSYLSNPALSTEAAEWLVSRRIKALGVDFATPDAALPRRGLDFDWPVHQILLSNGVLIAENLTGLAPLAGSRVEVVFGALNIEGGDGSPARIMARRVRS
jgi:kynurenine formamidase